MSKIFPNLLQMMYKLRLYQKDRHPPVLLRFTHIYATSEILEMALICDMTYCYQFVQTQWILVRITKFSGLFLSGFLLGVNGIHDVVVGNGIYFRDASNR